MDNDEFEKVMHSLNLARDLRIATTMDVHGISEALAFKLSRHFEPEGDMDASLNDHLESIEEEQQEAVLSALGESPDLEQLNSLLETDAEFQRVIVTGNDARNSIRRLKEYMQNNYLDDEAKEFATLCIGAFSDINTMLLEKDVVPLIKRGIYSEDIASAVSVWKNSSKDKKSDEAFWQKELSARKGILERLIGGHAIFLQREFHVGSTDIEGKGGRRSDFALIDGINNNVTLLEIKTPGTKLLGASYRNTFPLSSELSGTISQVLNQKNDLMKTFYAKKYESESVFEVFSPKCYIVVGDLKSLGGDKRKLKAFEVQRQAVAAHVTIVTFDELYYQFSTFNQV